MKVLKIHGQCVFPRGISPATVVIDAATGLIEAVHRGAKIPGAYGMGDALIFPGFIDLHVHCREDATGEESYKEDFETGGSAAVQGGVVHLAEMGNNPKPPIDDESYREKEALAKKSPVPVTLYAMMGPGTRPLRFPAPYKLCHARTTGKNDIIFFPDRRAIEATTARYRGECVSHHAEDAAILDRCKSEILHERRRPAEAEESAIDFAIFLTERYGLRSKLCHCSVATGIEKIAAAKKRGVPLTCEVTPHHLYFDASMITDANRPWMQMNPPLRSPEDRAALIGYLREGVIDILASDHAPHTEADKMRGASGQPHLDTMGPFATWLMAEQRFTPHDIARVLAVNPAKFLNDFLPQGFGKGYGRIEPGYAGSLTVINPAYPLMVEKERLKTKCGWSPFTGAAFPGRVIGTVVLGKLYVH